MLWTVFIGFFVGVLATVFIPGTGPGGIIATVILGIGGAMLANFIGDSIGFYNPSDFSSFLASVMGAMVILYIYGVMTKPKQIDLK